MILKLHRIILEALYPDAVVLNRQDWRTEQNIPWSKVTIVKDDFDGDYLAVFDKNYKRSGGGNIVSETGIVSNWGQNRIRVYAYLRRQQCGFLHLVCRNIDQTGLETKTLDIRVGDQVFNLRGENGNFPVSPELAAALYNAPQGKAKIRITLEGSGGTINNDIGEGTVKAWKVVYKPSK